MTGSPAGSEMVPGRRCCVRCCPTRMLARTSIGCMPPWTAPASARTSTPLALVGNPPRCAATEKGGAEPVAGEALGRSRGGLTTKIHLAAEGKGRPLAVLLSEGQRHDSTQLEPVLDRIRVPRQSPEGHKRPGRPR